MARAWLRWWFGVSGIIFGVLAALVVTAGALWVYLHGKSQVQVPVASSPTIYLRNDFNAVVLGKSESEVLEEVGKPDKTSEDAQAIYWHYRGRTKNPTTGQTDSDVQVVFERGRVIALNY
jgi:hypothetical protein